MKVLANDGIDLSAKQALEQKGFVVDTEKIDQDHLISGIQEKGYEVLLVRSATKVRKDVLDSCKTLKLIGRAGVGLDNIDTAHASDLGIKVFNTPASSSQAVAELVMAHVFSMARYIGTSNREMLANGKSEFKHLKKKYSKGFELRGKTIGIIGFGRIGQAVAAYAYGLGMNVLASDKLANRAVEISFEVAGTLVKKNVQIISKEELLKRSDIITLHVPKQDGGAVIGTSEFNVLKEGACIVNTARGGVVDEEALLQALNSGKIRAAALDVFEGEPEPDERLLKHESISVTPHTGASTVEAQKRIGEEIVENIFNFYN